MASSRLIGRMRAVLGLDDTEFQRGVRGAEASLQRMGRRLTIAGAAFSAAGAGMALAIRGQLNAADQMSKDAQKVGIPVDDLSRLAHAWEGVGRFGGISIPDEALVGVPTEFNLSLITDFPDIEPYTDTPIRGRVGQVFMGATTTPGGNGLIGAVEICAGTADGLAMRVEVQQQDGMVVTAIELKVTMTTGPSMRSMAAVAHSDEDQRRAFPDDTAGRHLVLAEATAQKTLWPAP